MVRTIAVRGGPFFVFVFVLFECARVESQPEAPLRVHSQWLDAFVFVLFGQPCIAECQETCARVMAEIESSCSHMCIHCPMFWLSTCAESSEVFQCCSTTIVSEVPLQHAWMA